MVEKENSCEIAGTEDCNILDNFHSLQKKYYKLEDEKRKTERKLEDLRKTIANNTFPYPHSYIEYIIEVVNNVRTACQWIMKILIPLCIFAFAIGMIELKQPDNFALEAFSVLGILIIILVISALGCITIPDKYLLENIIDDYIAHKKAEKVAEFYRLFPLTSEEANNQDTNINSAKSE